LGRGINSSGPPFFFSSALENFPEGGLGLLCPGPALALIHPPSE
jgi:hypothetical protein